MHKVAGALLAVLIVSGGDEPASGAAYWHQLAGHEENALRHYAWRMTGSDVIENGRKLKALARSPEFSKRYTECGRAAQTLSYMVTGQYFSSRRLAISADWHGFAPDYIAQRRACLADLGIDERHHPLPAWFGR